MNDERHMTEEKKISMKLFVVWLQTANVQNSSNIWQGIQWNAQVKINISRVNFSADLR